MVNRLRLKCSDRAILAERRSQQKKNSNTVLLNLELANSVTISSKVLSALLWYSCHPLSALMGHPLGGCSTLSRSLTTLIMVPATVMSTRALSPKHPILADAVAKRYRPWPKGLRTDSLPWLDSPLVQGASRLRYTDKAQVAATGPYWPKGARNKKK